MRKTKRPQGHCTWGHDLSLYGFTDSENVVRCRQCRKQQNRDRDFWKLVSQYTDSGETDQQALDQLKRFHWNEP